MDLMRIEKQGEVSVLTFTHGVTNPMGVEFIAELETSLKGLAEDSSVRGLVVTGSNTKFFSIGLDIPELIDLPRRDFEDFYKAFTRTCLLLMAIPKPVIAAIPGHAIAGGCIVALMCDYRFMASGRKLIGLNEVKLGLPVPYVATVALRNVVGYRAARDLMDEGEFYPPERALNIGLIDAIHPEDQLLASTIEYLEKLIQNPTSAYGLIKKTRVDPLLDKIQEGMEEIEKEFIDCWASPTAQSLLREAIAKY
jgi:enoyl-CoA hydratase/carnithine racemase